LPKRKAAEKKAAARRKKEKKLSLRELKFIGSRRAGINFLTLAPFNFLHFFVMAEIDYANKLEIQKRTSQCAEVLKKFR